MHVPETAQPPEVGLGEWPFHFADDEPSPLPPSPSSFDGRCGLHELDGMNGMDGFDVDADADDENGQCNFIDLFEFIPIPDSLSPPSSQDYDEL